MVSSTSGDMRVITVIISDSFKKDGTADIEYTGTFNNGVKVIG